MIDFPGITVSWGPIGKPLSPGAQAPAATDPSAATAATGETTGSTSAAEAEFLKYARMTPAERMHAAMLQKLGVTEDELKSMDADQRAAIEEKMRAMIKEEIEQDPSKQGRTGLIADITV